MTTSIVEIAVLGLTARQKEAILKLHEHWNDLMAEAPPNLIRLGLRLGFVARIRRGYCEFNDLGEAVVAGLKQCPPQAGVKSDG